MMISIVIPAHNEEEHIAATLRGIAAYVRTPHEILVVADHCTDRTESIVRSCAEEHPEERIRLLRNSATRGFGNAVITGLRVATGDTVVLVMADGCDNPETIDRMWETMERGSYDVVCGSRYMRGGRKIGGPILQSIFSRTVCYGLRVLRGLPTWDGANAFKMYRRTFLARLDEAIAGTGTDYSLALFLRAVDAGGRVAEIPTTWTWREPRPGLWQELRILRRTLPYLRALFSSRSTLPRNVH